MNPPGPPGPQMSDIPQMPYEDAEKEAYKILNKFLDPKNIAMQSEIHNVLALVKLQMLANYLKDDGYPKTSKNFQDFIDTFLLFMTSKDRGRVREICEALSAMNLQRRETLSLASKLMTGLIPPS